MNDKKPLLSRWTGAVSGFALGAVDTVVLSALGVELLLWIAAYFTASFVMLGFLLGLSLELSAKERRTAARLVEQAQKLSEAELRLAHADKLAALGQLASAMAHEVRNPLAIIRSTVQNLKETIEPGAAADRSCQFVLEEIDRLTRVTSSIVRFARPLSPERDRVRASELFEHSVALAERLLGARGVRCVARIEGETTTLADRDLICQAVLGLVDNAARFSPPSAAVELTFTSTGEELVIRVEDRGPGVAPEHLERLFEPFFTTRPDGAGLGLSIVREIVQAHVGTISVDNRQGGGARFSIRLASAENQELAA